MNERINELIGQCEIVKYDFEGCLVEAGFDAEKFAQLLLRNLAEELEDVAHRSKKVNPEWANGVSHAAMLAQRMTMALPQWPEAE